MRRDAIAPFVDHLEIELGYGLRLRFLLGFLSPNTCLACHGPGDCLLDMVPAPHPYVFWLAENSREKLPSIQSLVCRNFLQQLEHSFEITPHYDSAENSIGCRIFSQNVLHIRDARWCAPAFFPGFFGLGQKMLRLAIRLCQCFGECCKADVFRSAEQKQRCKKLQGSKIREKGGPLISQRSGRHFG